MLVYGSWDREIGIGTPAEGLEGLAVSVGESIECGYYIGRRLSRVSD